MKSIIFTVAALASVAYAGVAQPVVDAANAKSTVTLTATTSVGCSKSVSTEAPNSRCNVTGTLGKPSLISSKKSSLQDCQDACFFYSGDGNDCRTFGYNSNTNMCKLFNATLPQMKYKAGDSDIVYSNQHCLACAANPPAQASSSPSSSVTADVSSSSSKTKKTKTKTKTKSTSSTASADIPTTSSVSSSVSTSSTSKTKKSKTKSTSMSSISSSSSSVSVSSPTTSDKPKPTKASSSTSSSSSSTTTKTPTTPHTNCASKTVNVASSPSATTGIYKRYFVGSGVTENPANPGNRNSQQAPINSTLVGPFANDCDAITACAKQAFSASYSYFSFDLHLSKASGKWVCTQYYDPNTNATYFDQKNGDVEVAYGFYNTDF